MPCLSEPDVERAASGVLTAEETASCGAHLETCSSCRERIEQVRGEGDLLDCVRRVIDRLDPENAAASATPRGALGRYRLLERIGEGGMGTVYEAEQEDPPRRVALKFVRGGGASSHVAAQRLRREARMLARLQHPGIAQIFDAGTFDAGDGERPFFAMELARGADLASFAAMQREDRRALLELFGEICDAVHHAHQKGVIHCDLKPGNVRVTEDGEPKILDFGIARALESGDEPGASMTLEGQMLGTLPYMSPEQALLDRRAIDTRTDVYALGVILFEMLTGELPLDLAGRPLLAAAQELQHAPPRTLGSIDRELRGDLEIVVAKALAKEREQRYASASELAEDVRRTLRHEPIAARAPSAWYVLRKFARRHRALVAVAAGVLGALLAAVAITTQAMRRAQSAEKQVRLEKDEVERESLDATASIDFLKEVLAQAAPRLRRSAESSSASDLLELAAERVDERLTNHPSVRAAVHHVLGDTLRDLERHDEAQIHLEQALALYRELFGERHRKVAYATLSLAKLAKLRGRWTEARALAESVLAQRDVFEHLEIPLSPGAHRILAECALNEGRLDESIRCFRAELAAYEAAPAKERAPFLAGAKVGLALALSYRGESEEARVLLESAIAIREAHYGAEHTVVAQALYDYAATLQRHGAPEEALRAMERAVAIDRKWFQGDELPLARGAFELGLLLWRLERREEGEAHIRSALRIRRAGLRPQHPDLVHTLNAIGWMNVALGRPNLAEEALQESAAIAVQTLAPEHILGIRAHVHLGEALLARGRPREALAPLRFALDHAPRDAVWARELLGLAARALVEARRALHDAEGEACAQAELALLNSSASSPR